MKAMRDELARSTSQLQLQSMDKPYFIAYRMDELNDRSVSAMLGSITEEHPTRTRLLGVEVRVGDYALDNSNYFSPRDFGGGAAGMFNSISQAPLDDNYQQLRRELWLATDAQYKKALEQLAAKRAALQSRTHASDLPDFTREAPYTTTQPPDSFTGDFDSLKTLARSLSAVFKTMPEIQSSSVELEYRVLYSRYVNSEGSSFTRSAPLFKLQISAHAQATDGLPIEDTIELYGHTPSDIPATDAILARTRAMGERVLKLRTAPSLDLYNGPVLFEGEAAGEVFAQQFAPGLMAVRTPVSDDPRFEAFFNQMMGQLGGASFVDKIGGRVLPESLSLSDEPLKTTFNGSLLLGSFQVDDDAVKTRPTLLVDHGVLKTLLATRVPVRTVTKSTGSRRGWGPAPSNLVLTSDQTKSDADLRAELLKRAQARGLAYGIVVRRVGGGAAASFMRMAARMARQGGAQGNSLAEVYKVFPDGHEELVRGIEISEMAPATFKDIIAVGDKPAVFSDEFMPRVGALFSLGVSASPNLPVVSCVVPSLLFDEVSLAKNEGPYPNPPVSPSPLAGK
jgi:predicted Zn-dependent protease